MESDLGASIWLGRIVPNTVCDQFQKKTFWVSDKRVELGGMRIDAGYIAITIHWYELITGIYGSVLFYVLYCDNSPQVQKHTQIMHGNISMTQVSGTAERQTSARIKVLTPSESLYGNDLQCKVNGGK